MVTQYQTVNHNGEYSCGDIGVSSQEWLVLLRNEKAQPYIDALVSFLREPEQKASCSAVGLKYGKPAQHFNSKITSFSEWVQKTLGRFEVVGTDGNPTYWCIAIKTGWETKQGFVWQLRDELVEALRTYLMERLIEKFSQQDSSVRCDELYKWELLANTDGKLPVDIASSIVGQNIIDNERNDAVLKSLAVDDTEAFNTCLTNLFDESKALDERLLEYKSTMVDICKGRWKNCANDERTAASLLTCRYPQTYTIYKDEIYQLLCQYFGYESRKPGKKFSHFTELINELVSKHGEAVQNIMHKELERFTIKPCNLAVQTLFWCMKIMMKEELDSAVKNYWLVGYSYGNGGSQSDRFFAEGIWESKFNEESSSDQKLLKLAKCIKVGDIIILKSTSTKGANHNQPFLRIKGVGIVEGDIEHWKEDDYKYFKCKVNYISQDEIDFDGSVYGAYRRTIHQAEPKIQTVIDYVNAIINPKKEIMKPKYAEYIELLKEAHNLVLTGAPGTGKTYMAQAIAEEMGCTKEEMCFVQFHPSYDYTDFVEGLRPIEKNDGQMGFERKDGVFKEFCKKAIKNLSDSQKSIKSLTKELSWEEKLQQFVEDAVENNTVFKLSNGNVFTIVEIKGRTIVVHNEKNEITTQVSVNADDIIELLTNDVPLNIVRDIRNYFNRKFGTQPDSYAFIITKEIRNMKNSVVMASVDKIERKSFVFIIDEINRGEASKVFGELFYAIDPGYRGKKDVRVKTQYQNLVPETDAFAEGFYVPENVYILTTMNDIDRSVESMDFAMRRRFTWKEVTPADTQSMLDTLDCAAEAKAVMNRLNEVIADTEGLGAAYQVGPSYFLKLAQNGGNFDKLWKMNIEPLLREYLRGSRKAGDIMNRLATAYFNQNEVQENNNIEVIDED